MTIDNFANSQDANKLWWTLMNASDLRTIRYRVITRLIYDAKNGKFEN